MLGVSRPRLLSTMGNFPSPHRRRDKPLQIQAGTQATNNVLLDVPKAVVAQDARKLIPNIVTWRESAHAGSSRYLGRRNTRIP